MRYVTIKENRSFSRLYHRGKSFVSPALVTYVMKNRTKQKRYGITTGKKTGNAVKRSRSRRVIRAAYDSLYPQIREGFDFVFVARGKTPFVKSQVIKAAMEKHLQQAGALRSTGDNHEKSVDRSD